MDNNFSIGKRIRELRNQKHLSQEQLALSAEITTAYLGQIERNEKNPTVAVVAKICGALGIELSDFFSQKGIPQNELDSLTLQIVYQVKNENDEVKQIILQIIKQTLRLKKVKGYAFIRKWVHSLLNKLMYR